MPLQLINFCCFSTTGLSHITSLNPIPRKSARFLSTSCKSITTRLPIPLTRLGPIPNSRNGSLIMTSSRATPRPLATRCSSSSRTSYSFNYVLSRSCLFFSDNYLSAKDTFWSAWSDNQIRTWLIENGYMRSDAQYKRDQLVKLADEKWVVNCKLSEWERWF